MGWEGSWGVVVTEPRNHGRLGQEQLEEGAWDERGQEEKQGVEEGAGE